MNTRERFVRTLTGQDVDRVPFMKVFGGTNAALPHWESEYPGIALCIDEVLEFEGRYRGWQIAPVNINFYCAPGRRTVLEDDAEKCIVREADGTVEILRKGADYSHQTIEWPVKGRNDWDRIRSWRLSPDDPSRFPPNWPDLVAEYRRRDYPLQLTHGGVFGWARTLLGDEPLMYAFYDDPALVHEIMNAYTDNAIAVYERMCRQVEFDLIECWEDMASKNGSMISPETFRTFMAPQYRKLRAFADAHHIPIILVDSDGLIEGLVPLMLEAGVTAMYPFEVQSGNDCFKMLGAYPRLGIIGGLDKQVMARGKREIDAEIEKARALIRQGRFIPGPDHFVLSDVTFEHYRYFMERLRHIVLETGLGSA